MSSKRILICVGGTGGHLYPAQSLARRLLRKDPTIEILFVGAGLSKNRFFTQQDFRYVDIPASPLSLKTPLKTLLNLPNLWQGWKKSRDLLRDFKPQAAIGFGSYHAFPPLLAAKQLGIPIILHAADAIPGKVIRLFSKTALFVGVNFRGAAAYLKGKAIEVGMPIREGYCKGRVGRAEAAVYFKLSPEQTTLLVFGGSQGARNLNLQLSEMMTQFAEQFKQLQLIHITGDKTMAERIRYLYHALGIRSYVCDYEQRMDLAWSCADFAVTRAGASSLAEQIEWEVPGILIPYPHAADEHQQKNAEFVVKEIGGAIELCEEKLSATTLAEAVGLLFKTDDHRVEAMREGLRQFKQRPRKDFAALVYECLERKS